VRRTPRAFAWLRWRVLLNTLERSGGRDRLERFSMGLEGLAPAVATLVMVPTALMLAVTGAVTGWGLARGAPPGPGLDVLRFLLLGACVAAAVLPLVMSSAQRIPPARLLLLPIPRATLYAAQSFSALVEPWMLLVLATVAALPVGLAAGGDVPGAAAVLLAGGLLLAALTGIAGTSAGTIQLVVRSRRRGEILALVFLLGIPLMAVLPHITQPDSRQPAREPVAISADTETQPRWWNRLGHAALASVPAQGYVRILTAAPERAGPAAVALLTLAAGTAALHLAAYGLFVLLLASPPTAGPAATVRRGGARWRFPGVSRGTSAVAHAQVRLAMRTPRGRSVLLSPVVLFVALAIALARHPSGVSFAMIRLESGLALASFAVFMSLLSTLPLAANQFATDRAGMTLMLLSPMPNRAVIAGKTLGNACVAAIPTGICTVTALILSPRGHPALWVSIPLGLVATFLLLAPVAAALSAAFPRAVNLNSIGGDSNAHGAATLLGALWCLMAAAPCFLLVLVATRGLERPWAAPLLLLAWCAICAAVHVVLVGLVGRLFDRRRENLATVASRSR